MEIERLKGYIPNDVYDIIPEAFDKYEVNTNERAAHFLGQIAHESGDFRIKTESLYYSTASRIASVWPTRFNLDGSNNKRNAFEYTKNPQKLAEAVYSNRMGNTEPGDAYRYRGGGFLQLTGKAAYQEYADYVGKSVDEIADLVRSDNKYALDSALFEYAIQMKLNPVADDGMADEVIRKITRRINGGSIGLVDRTRKVNIFYQILTKTV